MTTHRFPLSKTPPQDRTPWGSRVAMTAANFPALRGMSLYRLAIAAGGFREPHWHPNADELGYCTSGRLLVTVFSSGNRHDLFTIEAGEMYVVPSGSFHSIENVGGGAAEIVAVFSHESPEDFGLSGSVGCMAPEVMGNTWGLPAAEVAAVTRSPEDMLFGQVDGSAEVPAIASFPNPLKFPVEAMPPLIADEWGSAKLARSDLWPALRRHSMFSLRLGGRGMREPHWHPETAELGYVVAGRARMTIKGPGGAESVDTFDLEPGDAYFVPAAYPHHIANLDGPDGEALHFLVFFDRALGADIGYTGGIAAFPRRIVAPTLGTSVAKLPAYPQLPQDLMIVKAVNPRYGPA
ncbi:MAG TPA: cupin domain-containing protein [Phycisphaerales bacterium]|nr:cupin domain-containing protein [Phycisphaerales bacterium]HMP37286.1 cupin domain-containing protein [Phycisphaerales bacterium]